MPLTREEVEYVAALARLGLNDAELTRLQGQLSSILEHIEAINKIDTNAIPPTAQVIAMTNVMRPDVVTEFAASRGSARKCTPANGRFLRGPCHSRCCSRGRLAVPDPLLRLTESQRRRSEASARLA